MASEAELRAKIRAGGMRATSARVAVLRLLESSSRPLSHADVCESLDGRGFDRATLFRNLQDFVERGLAVRTDLGDHVWRFSVREQHALQAPHHHFVCTECGTLTCVPSDAVEVRALSGLPRALSGAEVQLRGVCDRCDA